MAAQLSIDGNSFIQNGKPIQLLSGAIHYFRVVPEYWEDRLRKLKAMGLNTVETYVAWNMHEPQPGEFDFSGILDIAAFARAAGDLGLNVIVRPGPYICSEWDFGGLPYWLLKDPAMQLRCHYKPYLDAIDRYLDALMPQLAPLLATNGGPIVALQVENEYGSYGNDKEYLAHIERGLVNRGGDALLFTSDGPRDHMLNGGTLPHVLKTANFGSGTTDAFAKLREHQPEGPLMCMEFWCGWYDRWGSPRYIRDPQAVIAELENIVSAGASVNFYMFHGGTNFGFMAGANYTDDGYVSDTTSYDYSAPLSEWGEPTDKFYAARQVLERHFDLPPMSLPAPIPRRSFGKIQLGEAAPLVPQVEILASPVYNSTPLTMEELNQGHGYTLYRTTIKGPVSEPLMISECHDRAHVFLDGQPVGIFEREQKEGVELHLENKDYRLDILVENRSRINYGPKLKDRKGIVGHVRIGRQQQFGWTHFALPLDNLHRLEFSQTKTPLEQPSVYRAVFDIDTPADTFANMAGWTKGVVWINGFNLGRYWQIGPQKRLYLPGPLLRGGRNEIVVLEEHAAPADLTLELSDTPELG